MAYKSLHLGKYVLDENGLLSSDEWAEPKETQLRWDGNHFVVQPGNWIDPEVVVVLLNEVMTRAQSLKWIEEELLTGDDFQLQAKLDSLCVCLGAEEFDPNNSRSVLSSVNSIVDDTETISGKLDSNGSITELLNDLGEQLDDLNALFEVGDNDEQKYGPVILYLKGLVESSLEGITEHVSNYLYNADEEHLGSFASFLRAEVSNAIESSKTELASYLGSDKEEGYGSLTSFLETAINAATKDVDLSISNQLNVDEPDNQGKFAKYVSNKIDANTKSIVDTMSGYLETTAGKEGSNYEAIKALASSVKSSVDDVRNDMCTTQGKEGDFVKFISDKFYSHLNRRNKDSEMALLLSEFDKDNPLSLRKAQESSFETLKNHLSVSGELSGFAAWMDHKLNSISLPSSTLESIAESTLKKCQGNILTPSNFVDMERSLRGMAVTLSDEGRTQVVAWLQENLASSYASWVEIASKYSNQELEFANANSALGAQLANLKSVLENVAGINQSLASLGGWTGSIEQVSNRLEATRNALLEVSGSFCSLLNSTVDQNIKVLNSNVENALKLFTDSAKEDRDAYYKAELAIKTKELEIRNSELSLANNRFAQDKVEHSDLKDLKERELSIRSDAIKAEMIARGVEAVQKQYNASKDHDIEVAKLNKPTL